jgi:hypothetical protein
VLRGAVEEPRRAGRTAHETCDVDCESQGRRYLQPLLLSGRRATLDRMTPQPTKRVRPLDYSGLSPRTTGCLASLHSL